MPRDTSKENSDEEPQIYSSSVVHSKSKFGSTLRKTRSINEDLRVKRDSRSREDSKPKDHQSLNIQMMNQQAHINIIKSFKSSKQLKNTLPISPSQEELVQVKSSAKIITTADEVANAAARVASLQHS